MTDTLRRLAAYIPVSLARQLLYEGLPTPGQPHTLHAATLFSDISGFTQMSEELAADGPRGAEEVNRVLMSTFTAMIDIIHRRGGAVSHFYGDAMSVYFPDEDGQAALRALVCAQEMQVVMARDFKRVKTSRPAGANPEFPLTIKIGLGYGRCQEMIVGDPAESLEFVLTGTAVDEAATAEKKATKGEIVASRAILRQAGLPASDTYQVITPEVTAEIALTAVADRPLLDWQTITPDQTANAKETIIRFMPPAIYQRLIATSNATLAEHRPVTSMFVQFEYANDDDNSSDVGTALMGGQLQQYYQHVWRIVKRFGAENGRLNRVLTGDKGNQLHIMFGAPIAPDAPEQAIRCALALQREKPDFIASQKIGLATGKVFAGPVGAAVRSEYTVVGDVVNLSARLMQLCQPDGIVTDATTANRVRDLIEFATAAPVHLKGKQVEITPHYVQGDVAATAQIQAYFGRWQKPIIGREAEQKQLQAAMDEAWSGNGRLVIISGATGTGKTRLVADGVQQWLMQGGEGLVGASSQHTRDIPFALWRTIWQDFFGLRSDMKPKEQANIVIKRTQALLPDLPADDVGLWGEILGLPIPSTAVLADLTAEARQARFFTLARRCLRAAASTQPILLIIEDIHWADQASLQLIDEVALRLADEPILLTLLSRPLEEVPLSAAQQEWAVHIPLNDLSPDNARLLLQQLVGVAELPPLVEQHLGLRDRTGRDSPVNPLFLEESVNMLLSTGVLQVNGRVQVNDALLTNVPIPDTIHSLLLARLDRLPPNSRDVLQVASVIGREFALAPLESVTSYETREALIPVLTGLSQEQMTQLISRDPDWTYLFQHALTHEVAYESLPYARRQELHAHLADWLETRFADNLKPLYPILAYHFDRANIHDKCLHYALAAANSARDIFANKEAVELYTLAEKHLQALGIEERWETAVEIYLSRGMLQCHVGNLHSGLYDGQTALNIATPHDQKTYIAQSYNLLAEINYRLPDLEKTKALSNTVLGLSQVPPQELAEAFQWSGMAYTALGKYDTALDCLDKAEQLCLTHHLNRILSQVLNAKAFVYYSQKRLDLALPAMQKSLELSKNYATPRNLASAFNNIGLVQFEAGLAKEAINNYDKSLAILRESSRSFYASALNSKAVALAYIGDFSTAYTTFQQAIEIFQMMDTQKGLVETYVLLGYEYHCALKQWEMARIQFENAEHLLQQQSANYPDETAVYHLGVGLIALETGAYKQAEHHFYAAESFMKEKKIHWWRPLAWLYIGKLQALKGQMKQAKKSYNKGLALIYNESGCPDHIPLFLLGLAQLQETTALKKEYVAQCLEAIKKRVRFIDHIHCLEQISALYREIPELTHLAHHYQQKATVMSNSTHSTQKQKSAPDGAL